MWPRSRSHLNVLEVIHISRNAPAGNLSVQKQFVQTGNLKIIRKILFSK